MTNEQMKPGRFLRWHRARKVAERITTHLESGGRVVIGTCTRATVYRKQHAGIFRASKAGLFVQAGKRWDCIDFASIRYA